MIAEGFGKAEEGDGREPGLFIRRLPRLLAGLLAAAALVLLAPSALAASDEQELQLLSRAVEIGAEVQPEDFLAPNGSPEGAALRFAEPPDTTAGGEQTVRVIASIGGKDVAEEDARLLVCDRVLQLELDGRLYSGLKLRELTDMSLHGYHPDLDYFTADTVGVFPLVLTKGKEQMLVGLEVRDTVAPRGTAEDTVCYLGYPRAAADFVTAVEDAQPVKLSFVSEPDWDKAGERSVQIRLTDASGNRTELRVPTLFKKDDTPPVLTVDIPTNYYVGESVAYMKHVTAVDDLDPSCTISVDKSRVRQREVGVYPVVYTAVDRDGNKSSVTVKLNFFEPAVSDEELDELAQSVLDEILTDDMSVAEQAKAVYRYVSGHVRYSGHSNEMDWKGEAYRGLTDFHGDCYTFFSVSYLLLSKLDCEVLPVERIDGRTTHYWCLVNLGTGWYHFDTTPNQLRGSCFMETNKELFATAAGRYFWKYDEPQYPKVETEPFRMF